MSECGGATGAHPYQVLLSSWTAWAVQENFMPQIFPLGRAICLFLAYKTEVEARLSLLGWGV